jgi:hypothetical protein
LLDNDYHNIERRVDNKYTLVKDDEQIFVKEREKDDSTAAAYTAAIYISTMIECRGWPILGNRVSIDVLSKESV